eukprot:3305008-Prymnesium_polylepis.1
MAAEDADGGLMRSFSFEHKQMLRSRAAALVAAPEATPTENAAVESGAISSAAEGDVAPRESMRQAGGKAPPRGAMGLAAAVRTLQASRWMCGKRCDTKHAHAHHAKQQEALRVERSQQHARQVWAKNASKLAALQRLQRQQLAECDARGGHLKHGDASVQLQLRHEVVKADLAKVYAEAALRLGQGVALGAAPSDAAVAAELSMVERADEAVAVTLHSAPPVKLVEDPRHPDASSFASATPRQTRPGFTGTAEAPPSGRRSLSSGANRLARGASPPPSPPSSPY